ncbi:MAG: type II toxin-antitoxin system VapB family antitoxin [Alphaproteobacteria bacterium]|nr:type II toxin-antitoxin system VapB family antitoxin [Alphaproteobacteria bacterium]
MGLNIKTDEAHRLAKKIAEKTGESLTVAVTTALQERLAKIEKQDRIDNLTAIAKRIAERLNAPGGPKMMEIEELYDDETGLPK